MSDSSTLTVSLSADTEERLSILSARTRRTRSFLAAEAIARYVARELAIVDAIEAGRTDVRENRITPHDEVVRQARDVIEAARRER